MTRAIPAPIAIALAVLIPMSAGTFLPVQDAAAQSAQSHLTDPALARAFNRISDRLTCQCGCNDGLRVCNHQNCPSAIPMRRTIEKKLTEGQSEDEIVNAFVKQYGVVVLSTPPAEGFNLAAWVMPGFAILIGLFLIFHFAGHWVARRKLAAAQPAPDVDPEMQKRIERELDSMER